MTEMTVAECITAVRDQDHIPDEIKSRLITALDGVEVVGESDPLVCHPPVHPIYACDFRADGEDGMCSPCRIWFAWENRKWKGDRR